MLPVMPGMLGEEVSAITQKRGTVRIYGMMAVFKWPLWLIRCCITSSRLASGSTRFTKSLAR